MKATELHPVVRGARRAIRRALPSLTTVQVVRLAATAELLAYGEDRGQWSLSVDWAAEQAQPYQVTTTSRIRRGADRPSYQWQCDKPQQKGSK